MTCPSCGSEELEYAEWLAQEDRLEEAEPLLAEARETLERFRARPWLERLNAVGADNGRHSTLKSEPVQGRHRMVERRLRRATSWRPTYGRSSGERSRFAAVAKLLE